MLITETSLKGAFLIDIEQHQDTRGFFARTFCQKEFSDRVGAASRREATPPEYRGLKPTIAQCNVAFNYKKGTLRGMHYQVAPATEVKLVRCIHGAIYDVIIDLRPESPTYKLHIGVELTAENHRALYVPEMFAHGYQTLTDDAEVVYQMSEFYAPDYQRGLRYDDPSFGIEWALPITEISDKDISWSPFKSVVST